MLPERNRFDERFRLLIYQHEKLQNFSLHNEYNLKCLNERISHGNRGRNVDTGNGSRCAHKAAHTKRSLPRMRIDGIAFCSRSVWAAQCLLHIRTSVRYTVYRRPLRFLLTNRLSASAAVCSLQTMRVRRVRFFSASIWFENKKRCHKLHCNWLESLKCFARRFFVLKTWLFFRWLNRPFENA